MTHLDLGSETLPASPSRRTSWLYLRYGKRALDVAIALLILPVVAPLIAIICLMTRLDGHAGLFGHTRIGQEGKPFTCWKIRTMVPDAEARLAAHLASNPNAAGEWAKTQKLQDDPRTTRLGRVLRRTSLDELPQIWNVLRGDMSLVGPRPVTAKELERYGPLAPVYLSLRPGITGQWQIHGRRSGCYDERLKLDQLYAAQIGPWRDLVLIAATVLVVFWPTGN